MAKGRSPLGPVNSQQSVAERRALRGQYRQLSAETLAGKENLLNGGTALQDLLQRVDALHSKVARPREHAVDAEVFAQLTQCGLQMIKQGAAVNEGRTPADLMRAIRFIFNADPMTDMSPVSGQNLDWAGLGASVTSLYKTAPGIGCMLGPLEAQAKVRKAVVRQPKRPLEALTRPEELEAIEEADKQETDRNYENMWRQLKEHFGQQVSIGRLVCNHKSFAQTVENIFTLSFLVRDQRVKLLADPELGMSVQPIKDGERAAAQQAGSSRAQQFMMSFTMQDWDVMKQLVAEEDCIMPHRGSSSTARVSPAAAAAGATSAAALQKVKRVRRE